jgi:dipeptidyl aminopeptidase/acylaminoacyl peptidase
VNSILPRAGGVVISLGLLFVVRVAARSYWGERQDFDRTPSTEISRHPESAGIPSLQEIEFPGPAGLRLAGWYVPSQNHAAVVLAHGASADRSSLLPETKILAAAGFGVLALDFPGQGASQGKTLWGVQERQSISAALDWLGMRPEVDAHRIGGFGLSLGGYILTQAAVLDVRLRAVALAAAPSDIVEQTRIASNHWGPLSEVPAIWALRASGMPYADMRPKDVISRISPRAVFILGGDLDEIVPESMTRTLYRSAQEPKELWIVHGARHGDYAKVASQEYAQRLVEFFLRTLAP